MFIYYFLFSDIFFFVSSFLTFFFFLPCHRACRILSCSCSVSQLCLTLYDPMDCSMPGLPVSHHLPESTKHMSIELMMFSKHLILCRPFSSCLQSFPASGSFQMSQFFVSGGASASVLPMNIPGWFPLGLTGWISLQSKGLPRVLSNTTVQKHQFFSIQPSLWSNSHFLYMTTGKTIAFTIPTFAGKVTSLLFNMLSIFVIVFLPRSKHRLISWLQSLCAVILKPWK